ncbi:MAG TPA: ASPIC/UnbV domain-containing protein, partial [Vicinamibacteria bacterium]
VTDGAPQRYEVQTAAGYLSASDKRLLIGLGAAVAARRVEIRWPSGALQRLENVPARQVLTVTEPAS